MDDLRLWDSPNSLVEGIYSTDNYEVIDYDNGKICYIFFSSNGLFFPDTISQFKETIIDKNRYEWKRMATGKEIISKSGRHIFVRDIYKQWYTKGISNTVNSIDKMIPLLKALTEKNRITRCPERRPQPFGCRCKVARRVPEAVPEPCRAKRRRPPR